MVQKQQVRRPPAIVETIPEAEPAPARSSPWLIFSLVVMIVAFLALVGWTAYQRYVPTPSERIAQDTAAAWSNARPADLANVYARGAVVVEADGTRLSGIQQIVAAAKQHGAQFSMAQVDDIAGTADGSLVTMSYQPAGGRATGVAVLEIANGKVIQQWNFESALAPK